MSEHDAQRARDLIRESFPLDEGLSAEKTRELYARLRSLEAPRRRRPVWAIGIGVAAVLALGAGLVGAYAARSVSVPPTTVAAEDAEATTPPANASTATAPAGRVVPAMALRAITESASVLHFTSVADDAFGPNAGHSAEEMWFDPKSGAGRLVRKDYRGGHVALTTTIVSDGSAASITLQKPGGEPVTQVADPKGAWRRAFDKLSAYRQMLESGTATVTARGTSDGVETYKLRADVPAFGGSELDLVMEAEVRASDYLPLSFSSSFRSADGKKVLRLRTRTFSKFEHLDDADLPSGWFVPAGGQDVLGSRREPGALEL